VFDPAHLQLDQPDFGGVGWPEELSSASLRPKGVFPCVEL